MDERERVLRDAREMQVLAHPVRMRLRQALYELGRATATELAEVVGESPANCSWHLRQLAKYGFVEEAGGGKGRHRPWRPTRHPLSWGDSDESGEVAAASDVLSAQFFEQEFAGLREWQAWRRTDPAEWQDAANWVQNIDWLTIEELRELNEALVEIVSRHRKRRDPADRPAGSRRVRVFAWAVPAEPYPGERAAASHTGETPAKPHVSKPHTSETAAEPYAGEMHAQVHVGKPHTGETGGELYPSETPAQAHVGEPHTGEAPAAARTSETAARPHLGEASAAPHIGETAAGPYAGEVPAEPYVSRPRTGGTPIAPHTDETAAGPYAGEVPAQVRVREAHTGEALAAPQTSARPQRDGAPPQARVSMPRTGETPVEPHAGATPAETHTDETAAEPHPGEGPGEPYAGGSVGGGG